MKPENRLLLSLTGLSPVVLAWGLSFLAVRPWLGLGSSQRLTVTKSIRVGCPGMVSEGCYRAPGKAPDSYSPGGGAA